MLVSSGDRLDSRSPLSANGSPQKPASFSESLFVGAVTALICFQSLCSRGPRLSSQCLSLQSLFDCSLTSPVTSVGETTILRWVSRGLVDFLVMLSRASGRTVVIPAVLLVLLLSVTYYYYYYYYYYYSNYEMHIDWSRGISIERKLLLFYITTSQTSS